MSPFNVIRGEMIEGILEQETADMSTKFEFVILGVYHFNTLDSL